MEVHHHSNHPQKWIEYISEFLMLFTAVTLGFFAENLRDHQIEKRREIRYLETIHLDLQRDMIEIDHVIGFNIQKQKDGAELTKLYMTGVSTNLPKFYFLVKTLAYRFFFQHSKIGFEQLKNAGGLRIVEDGEIIQQLQIIEIRVADIEAIQESIDLNLTHFRIKTNTVLDASTVQEMNVDQKLNMNSTVIFRRYKILIQVRPLHENALDDINELVNLAISPINTSQYLNAQLIKLKRECFNLNQLLIRKFGKEFYYKS